MRRFILSLILLLIMTNSLSAKMKLSVEGLSGELADNVNARLSMIDENKVDDTPYFKNYAATEIKKGLRALGYYQPILSYHVPEGGNTLIISVDPGQPILIERTDIDITGQGAHDKDYIDLLKYDVPKKGTVLNHGTYDSFKKRLQSIALRKGYFDANMTKSQLAVSESLHEAFWFIDFNTGERYKFGQVTFNESEVRDSYLKNIIPFKYDEPYTSDQLSLLSRRLSSTNWFRSVTVVPMFNAVGDDKVLPIKVITTPRKHNIVDTGLGYSSDNGLSTKLGWNMPLLNNRGHSFQSNLALSSPEQSITGVYKIPLYKSPLEDYYTVQGGYKKVDNKDTYSNSYSAGVIRNWDSFEGWQSAIGLNILFDDFTQANDSYKTFLLYPSFSFSRARTDGKLFPMWADSQRYSLEVASADIGSDIDLVRFQIQQVWIRSIEDNHRFVIRGSFGIIQASDFDRVPPSFRFFAGGDRSVRGYGYQSISPKDKDGQLKGGSRLVTGSLEYQYHVTGAWWGAVFVDTGEAVDKIDKTNFYTGAGVGVRWISPIGPIKFDIATPINKDNKSPHFYIGLGSEL